MFMMGGDKRRAVTAILGPESDNVGVRDGEGGDALSESHAIASELIEAIKAGDAAALVEAFKALNAACAESGYEEPAE